MTKSKQRSSRRSWKQRPKVLKARYDANSHFTAFDIRPIRLNGKAAAALRRGTLQGASRKEITKMLMRVAETFDCRKIELESVGGARPASTCVEITGSNAHQHA